MKTWLLAVVASMGLLSGRGGPMEADESGAPVTEDVTQAPDGMEGQVTQAACPDPAYSPG